jgi:hypothetical protein
MLLIKARVRPSTIHGLGLFAEQFIPSGTIIFSRDLTLLFQKTKLTNSLRQHANKFCTMPAMKRVSAVLFCRVTTTVFPITPIIPIPYKTAIPCSRAVILSAAKKLPVATTK